MTDTDDWQPGPEPWNRHTARKVILTLLVHGEVIETRHVKERMRQRRMCMADVLNVLRGGWVDESLTDFHPRTRSLCYRVATNDMWVEVAFDYPNAIRLVSCGRYR